MRIKRFYRVSAFAVLCWFAGMVISAPAFARDEAFHRWLEALWPQAHMAGISRATFDEATRDLEPDLSLPDLIIPGRPEKPDTQQAEFIKSPAEYLSVPTLARL